MFGHDGASTKSRRACQGPPPSSDSSKGTCSATSASTSCRARAKSLLPSSTRRISSSRLGDRRGLPCAGVLELLTPRAAVSAIPGVRGAVSGPSCPQPGSAESETAQQGPAVSCLCAVHVVYHATACTGALVPYARQRAGCVHGGSPLL